MSRLVISSIGQVPPPAYFTKNILDTALHQLLPQSYPKFRSVSKDGMVFVGDLVVNDENGKKHLFLVTCLVPLDPSIFDDGVVVHSLFPRIAVQYVTYKYREAYRGM